jgi:ferredoxin-type protein NapH
MTHQRLGLTLFLLGFAIFLASLTLSQYRLTDQLLAETVRKEHLADLRKATQPMLGQTYPTIFGFVADIRTGVNGINEGYKSRQEWPKVIYDNYAFSLAQAASVGFFPTYSGWFLAVCVLLTVLGTLVYVWPGKPSNDGIYQNPATNRGWVGMLVAVFLVGLYVALYFYPEYLANWVLMFDPLSHALSGNPASQWFVYGTLYTLVILVMGVRMLLKYRGNPYQQVRTLSVMFFQLCFAFVLPEIFIRLNQPYQDLKNIWPLDYSFYFDYRLDEKIRAGTFGVFLLVWGTALWLIGVPVLTYFFGKRWYCSWVCGCGGLAETLGDPYRQLSDKRLIAWKIERVLVHGVLVFAVLMTALVLYTYVTKQPTLLGVLDTYTVRSGYGFWIGSLFSGVVGTGFYPVMGSRVWCRFGCPLAAYLGMVQRFRSRFRITTNGGQCISCGNCSTYCEMGIDVRWYAQRGQDIVRSSCVGCGICSAVCPRGVLNLENRAEAGRLTEPLPILLGNDRIRVQA